MAVLSATQMAIYGLLSAIPPPSHKHPTSSSHSTTTTTTTTTACVFVGILWEFCGKFVEL
jgi:hypothetical protein